MKFTAVICVSIAFLFFTGCNSSDKNNRYEERETPQEETSEYEPKEEQVVIDPEVEQKDSLADENPNNVIKVNLKEWTIDMPETAYPGTYTFIITNEGNEPHSLQITGPGVSEHLETDLNHNEINTLKEVVLVKGKYKIVCPKEGHETNGMVRTLAVN